MKISRFSLLLTMTACTTPGPIPPKALSVLVSSGDQDPFDPNQSAQATFTLYHSFFCYPLRLDQDQNIVADAVQRWTWSSDQRTLTLELDPTRRFHDGRPIRAEDLEFALVRPFLTQAGTGATAKAEHNIDGSDRIHSGMPFHSGMVSGIKILGSHQLSVTLKQADPDFLYYLASMAPQLVPEDALTADKASFRDKPVSCGDYRVTAKAPDGSRYFMEKFRAPAEAPERVELWNYEFAKLPARPDVMMGGLFSRDKLDPSYRREWTQQPTQVFTFVLNDKAPIVQFPAFRRALDLAMPRQEMSNLPEEFPAMELTLPTSPAFLGLPVKLDLVEAKRLWSSLPDDLRQQEYRVTVKTNYPGPYFQAIEKNLRSMGMKVTMVGKQMKNFKAADEQDLMLGLGMILLRGSPIVMYQRFDARQLTADPFPAFAQEEMQALLDTYKIIPDPKDKAEMGRKIAHFTLHQNLVIPMTYARGLLVFSPNVKSYEAPDAGITLRNLRAAY